MREIKAYVDVWTMEERYPTRLPVLVQHGEDDAVAKPENSEYMLKELLVRGRASRFCFVGVQKENSGRRRSKGSISKMTLALK